MIAHKNKSDGTYFWQDPAYLKGIREAFHPALSQEELARKSGVSRSIIANYETGATYLSSVENTLKLYMTLEAFGSAEAGRAVLAILRILKGLAQKDLARVEAELNFLQKRREAAKTKLAEIESEEKRLALKMKGREATSNG